MRRLVNLLLPDVTRHLSRRPDTLATNWGRYRRAYTAAERVHAQLRHDKGPTRAVLQLARTLFNDGRLAHDEVQRWHQARLQPSGIAVYVLAKQTGQARGTWHDIIALALQASNIEERWDTFLEFLRVRPESEQRRVFIGLRPSDPLPPAALTLQRLFPTSGSSVTRQS